MSFTIASGWYANTTETLYNSDYDMTLTLYSNGYCTLKASDGSSTGGRYEIDSNNWITLNWDRYDADKGFVNTVQTTTGKRIKSVVADGKTFTNTQRFVVPRQ